MIHLFVGTGAELIKVIPVMRELQRRGFAYRYVDSSQHARTTRWVRQEFGLRRPDHFLCTRRENVASLLGGMVWLGGYLAAGCAAPWWVRRRVFPGGGIVLIHGDTASAFLGLQLARRAGLDVGLIESGLRSFSWLSPFPEEIIRVCAARRCEVLFPPSAAAAENLHAMGARGRIVPTGGNTIVDALRIALTRRPSVEVPEGPFALAAIHRLETLTNYRRLVRCLRLVARAGRDLPVLFITYPPTMTYLRRFKLLGRLDRPGVRAIAMLPHYHDFIALVRAAEFVLADGCGVQEECACLNKPYLILRDRTERDDGLGKSAVLWKFDEAVAEGFLRGYRDLAGGAPPAWPNPSRKIVDALDEMGYCDAAPTAARGSNPDVTGLETSRAGGGGALRLRSGIPTPAEVDAHCRSALYREMLAFDDAFVERHRRVLRRYMLRWGGRPMRLFSRRWEYPYAAQCLLDLAAEDASRPLRVLDAGSGVTFFPYFIRRRIARAEFTCCDANAAYADAFDRINRARGDPAVRFLRALLQDLPLDDDAVDAVTCISVLEHTGDYPTILDELRRAIRPGGLLVLTFDVSLDGRCDIPVAAAADLLQAVEERFDLPEGLDWRRELDRTKRPEGILTTDAVRRTAPDLLPWKWPALKSLYDLARGRGWTGGFFSLTTFCLHARRRAPSPPEGTAK